MNKFFFTFLLLAGFSCAVAGSVQAAGEKVVPANEKHFIADAYSSGMLEVQLGQMAQSKGKMQAVKDFGARMEGDHARANEELKRIAERRNVALPANLLPAHQGNVKKLMNVSGDEFDKAYMQETVREHTNDIAQFKAAARTLKDKVLKSWVDRVLPRLAEHLQLAKEVAAKVGASH